MQRSLKLNKGLVQEKDRWTGAIVKMKERIESISGDIIQGSSALAYFGPLDQKYRTKLLESIRASGFFSDFNFDQNFDLGSFIESETAIQNWHNRGLAYDTVYVQNVIIQQKSQRSTLNIDPQK